jgi:hypothetical protein
VEVTVSNHVPVNDAMPCPRCGGAIITVLVSTPPRCVRCLNCRHTWDEPYLRPVRDRRQRAEDPL